MNNFCVTSQLDDMLMSSAMGSEGKSNQGTIFQRRDSRLSNNDKNLNLFSNDDLFFAFKMKLLTPELKTDSQKLQIMSYCFFL